MKLIRSFCLSITVLLFLFLTGCGPNLPVYKYPQFETSKIKVGILPFKNEPSNYSFAGKFNNEFRDLFAAVAYNTSAFEDIHAFDNKSEAKDVDYIVQGRVTKINYDRGVTIGTFTLPLLTAIGGLFLFSNPEIMIYGYLTEAGAFAFALESLIDKHFYYHDYDLAVEFQMIDARTGKSIYTEEFSHSIRLIFDEAETYSYGGEMTPSGFLSGVKTFTTHQDLESICKYCFFNCIQNISEKFIRKVIELNITPGKTSKGYAIEKPAQAPQNVNKESKVEKSVQEDQNVPKESAVEKPEQENQNTGNESIAKLSAQEEATSTKKFLESQFYVSLFNRKKDLAINWENMQNEFAVRVKNNFLINSYKQSVELYLEKDTILKKYAEEQLNKNGIYKTDRNFNYNYYLLLYAITYLEEYRQKSMDASTRITAEDMEELIKNSQFRHKQYKYLDSTSVVEISHSFEAKRKYAEWITAKVLSDAAEDKMLNPAVCILSSPFPENEKVQCLQLQSLQVKDKYPAFSFNEKKSSNTFTNIFTAKYFSSAKDKNKTFIECEIGDGIGTMYGIPLTSNAVRYRYFPNNKDASYFTFYAFGLGMVLPLTDSFEEKKLGITTDNSSIYLTGKDQSNVNFRIYAGNIEILNKYQNDEKIKWFNTNIEAGGDLNFNLGSLNFQAGVKYGYNSFYYYGGLGFNVETFSKEGDALIKFNLPAGVSKSSGFNDNADRKEPTENRQKPLPSAGTSKEPKKANEKIINKNAANETKKEPVVEKPLPVIETPVTKWTVFNVRLGLNNSAFSPEAFPFLVNLVDTLLKNPNLNAEIRGYTDNVGADTYNQTISKKRADIFKDYLISKGIDAGRLTSVGYGEVNPIADNKFYEGRAKNNRVELIVKSKLAVNENEGTNKTKTKEPVQNNKTELKTNKKEAPNKINTAENDQKNNELSGIKNKEKDVTNQINSFSPKTSEKFIATVDNSWLSFEVSPDSRHVAFAIKSGDKMFVTIDGKEEKQFDGILKGTLNFSEDGKRFAYGAAAGGKNFIVVDGKEETQYDSIFCAPQFSKDSKHLAYAAGLGDRRCVVVDGKEEKQYDGILSGTPIFSPSGNRLAYGAKVENKWFVVVDGNEEKWYDGILGALSFSSDGKHLAYAAELGDKVFVVLDGKEGKQYDIIFSSPVFSPDGAHMAYAAGLGDRRFVVVDGKEEKQYDAILKGSPIFSADGKHLAYSVVLGDKKFVVVDGKEEKMYDAILEDTPIFSPDSKRVAYGVKSGNKEFVVLDGNEEKQYDGTSAAPVFSPDSKHVAYGAKMGNKRLIILDRKEEKLFDGIGVSMIFSSDSRHFAYGAKLEDKWFVVINGKKEEQQYDAFIKGSKIIFDTNYSLHFLVLKGNGVYLVEKDLR